MRYLRVAGTELHHIQDEESEEKGSYEAICGEVVRFDRALVVDYLSAPGPLVCKACRRECERWQDGDVGETSGQRGIR